LVEAQKQFDIVIGSEVIYEEEHSQWVSSCLSTFVKPGGVVYMIASMRPERPGWVALKEIMPNLCGGDFQIEVVPVQRDMPLELHQDVAEQTDFLHEMLCGRRRASAAVGDDKQRHVFPGIAQTLAAPDSAPSERSEPRTVRAGAVQHFLGSMPAFS
jgi:hypothetical protein